MRQLLRVLVLALVCISLPAFAEGTLGDLADSLMGPAVGLVKIIYAVFWVAGASFVIGAIIQYMQHRENPQQVRLSKPVFMLLLGILLIIMPFLGMSLTDIGSQLR